MSEAVVFHKLANTAMCLSDRLGSSYKVLACIHGQTMGDIRDKATTNQHH